jgi:hypothetical protein
MRRIGLTGYDWAWSAEMARHAIAATATLAKNLAMIGLIVVMTEYYAVARILVK